MSAIKSGLPYRVKRISWWEQELPTKEEIQEGIKNLKKVDFLNVKISGRNKFLVALRKIIVEHIIRYQNRSKNLRLLYCE